MGCPAETCARGEALEDSHGIVGGEHRHRRPQADAPRAAGNGGEHDLGRRYREVGAMVLADADADEVDAAGIGENGLIDDVADDLSLAERRAVIARGHVAERVQTEFKVLCRGRPGSMSERDRPALAEDAGRGQDGRSAFGARGVFPARQRPT